MSTERPDRQDPPGDDPRTGTRPPPGDPIVTESPSSHQPHSTPPAGSEPQGRVTLIAAIATLIVIVLIVIVVFL